MSLNCPVCGKEISNGAYTSKQDFRNELLHKKNDERRLK